MMVVLRPTYSLEVVIKRPQPNFTGNLQQTQTLIGGQLGGQSPAKPFPAPWDEAKETGCDEVVAKVREVLAKAGFTDMSVRLSRYEEAP